ncbi:putative conserved secreted protein [Synechococcus sp. BIOS-E4-1]|uniref:hypothetical protein n=1 Tax=Synechococcus sp. BIOS-E4-1 TaxID=1400864 RepID=UPI00185F8A42|nr:hypothetical protein [Synechococcus sp. BIOS-E4-1]QNI53714.1 putative conserved secreted protein [Synechococcus sp. BIOS-E4-1]
MADQGPKTPQSSDPRWFVLMMASRWPLAVVIAAWAIAVAAIQILRQPIPIGLPLNQPFPVRLVGGITVDKLSAPVSVKGEEPLSIEAVKVLPVSGDVGVPKGVAVTQPVNVKGGVSVDGSVTVGEVTAPVSVNGPEGGPVLVGTPDGELLNVTGGVKVDSVGGKINVQLRDAAKSVLPIP